MTPQEIAKSIADELREHPERWNQGSSGRTDQGWAVPARDPAAIKWCLMGHKVRRDESMLATEFAVALGFASYNGLTYWNDHPERTVADVIALCDKVSQS